MPAVPGCAGIRWPPLRTRNPSTYPQPGPGTWRNRAQIPGGDMVTRDTPWPAGTPCWVDLGVDDVTRARAWYGSLFGWEIQEGPPEAGGYSMAEVGGRPVAGIGPKMGPPDVPSAWTTYLATADADETITRSTAGGGGVLTGAFDVLDVGRMAVAADPDGAVFGLWQARVHTGFRLANEPGSVCWNENLSRNFDGNKSFYQAVFGFDYGDMSSDAFHYATIELSGHIVGGIGDIGPDQAADAPARWSTYFGVADTDAAVARAQKLGGVLVRPARDSPYGRMAVVTDDQGAAFALMQLAAESAGAGGS